MQGRQLFVLGCLILLQATILFAQDEPIPKTKPKTSTVSNAKSDSKHSTSTQSSKGILLVLCDLACTWKLDGEAKGTIAAGGSGKANVVLGEHILVVTTLDGLVKQEQRVELTKAGQKVVEMKLNSSPNPQPTLQPRESSPVVARPSVRPGTPLSYPNAVWTDPATGLMWAKQSAWRYGSPNPSDDFEDSNWQQATLFCQGLQLAGHTDWRLPTIEELQAVYQRYVDVNGQWVGDPSITWHRQQDIDVSGWPWSSSTGNTPGEAWIFYFQTGASISASRSDTYGKRALCVRR